MARVLAFVHKTFILLFFFHFLPLFILCDKNALCASWVVETSSGLLIVNPRRRRQLSLAFVLPLARYSLCFFLSFFRSVDLLFLSSFSLDTLDTLCLHLVRQAPLATMADGNSDLREQAKQWMEWDPNDRTRQVVADALESSSSSEASSSASGPESATAAKSLKELFGSRLEFGTAGLRGPMSAGSSGINDLVVLQTAQGICAYAQQVFGMEELRRRGVVFGFDHRQHPQLNISSRRFAEISAAVFLSQEVPVLLFSDLVATPFVPFCIVERECCLGVMVTASHNPKEDNGYKIYWADGVQITPPHDTGISNAIAQNLEPWAKVKALLQADASGDKSIASATTDPTKEISAAYFQKSTEALARHPAAGGEDSVGFDVVYTAMHGVGHVFARQMFQAFGLPAFIPVESQVNKKVVFLYQQIRPV